MSNNAMSKETVLDWLARNVHVWPEGDDLIARYLKDGNFAVASVAGVKVSGLEWFTKDQWLSRCAELQNKPSWADHPDAKCFVQDYDGTWFKNTERFDHIRPGDKCGWVANVVNWVELGQGEVLGDWRDTLEKRTEEFKPSIEDANRLAQEFKPFTSIEDNQEKDMKQDNGWFERGELPPVGSVCEYTLGANAPWYQCEIKYVIRDDGVVMKRIPCGDEQYCGLHHRHPVSFRPIRTEREVAVDEMMKCTLSVMNQNTQRRLFEDLYDAGYRKEFK